MDIEIQVTSSGGNIRTPWDMHLILDDSKKVISKILTDVWRKGGKQCYLLNVYGKYTFEECFGKTNSHIENEQRYQLAKFRRVLKYYLIEDYHYDTG